VFGYTISSIGQIFASMTAKSDMYKEKMTMMSIYLKKRKLSHQLQVRVKKYFEYYFTNMLDSNGECEKLMERLTSELKVDVRRDMYMQTLESCQLLKSSFSKEFLHDLCQRIKVTRYNPGDKVFNQNDVVKDLRIVLFGQIKVYVNRTGISTSLNR
jgi:hypothetical protein